MPAVSDLAGDLREIITALCKTKPVLVGWSMGAATVMEYIRLYGCDAIKKVVLVDYPPRVRNDDSWHYGRGGGRVTAQQLDESIRLSKTDFDLFLHQYYLSSDPRFAALSETERTKALAERMQGHHPKVLASLWESLNNADYRDVLPMIGVPAAVFYADTMPVCCREAAEYYAKNIPGGARLRRFQNASHALLMEYPEKFARELRDFIAEE
jgi:pimeloyl-ACP methyl ester carboxylesterase